ncbi:restriction endonuclease subunit S [Pirellulaceae bacterium SH467]
MAVKKGYKQTEVGLIPSDWLVTTLRSVLDSSRPVRYGVVQPGEFVPQGQLMLRSQDYSKGWTGPEDMHRINSALEKQYRNARITSGDLIMTIVGAGIGQVVSAPEWLDGAILSRSTSRIAVDPRKAAKRYIAAFLESPFGKRQIIDCQKEGAQPVVSCPDLARFLIPLPPLLEQEAIAGALSDADAWIESLEQLIAKKRQIKQGAMQELLTGKRRLPAFSGEWEKATLGDLGRWMGGMTPSMANANYWYGGDFPWVSSGDVKSTRLTETSQQITKTAIRDSATSVMPAGSIIIVNRSGILRRFLPVALLLKEMAINQDIKGLILKPGLVSEFVLQSLLNAGPKILSTCVKAGTTVESLELKWLKKFPISIPDSAEQTAIATVLSDMDTEIQLLELKLSKALEVKQGMMQELLTGRIRLV